MLAVYRWDLPGAQHLSDYFVVELREGCDLLLVRLSDVVGNRWEEQVYQKGYFDRCKDDHFSRVS